MFHHVNKTTVKRFWKVRQKENDAKMKKFSNFSYIVAKIEVISNTSDNSTLTKQNLVSALFLGRQMTLKM